MTRFARPLVVLAVIGCWLSVARAAEPAAPEALLAQDSILYFRCDGLAAHRKTFEQTALADVMNGDLGQFAVYCWQALGKQIPEAIEEMPQAERTKFLKALPVVLGQLKERGAVVGLEVSGVVPAPAGQLTLVFPNAAKQRQQFHDCFTAFAALGDFEVRAVEHARRKITVVEVPEPLSLAFWVEGEHVVVVCGSENYEHTLDRLEKKTNLTQHPLYQQVAGFKAYDTLARGFVDVNGIRKLLGDIPLPGLARTLDQLGLNELTAVTWHCGFQEKCLRTTLALQTTGERKGLLKLATQVPAIDLAKLPPLPPDATDVAVFNLDLAGTYDLAMQAARTFLRPLDADGWAEMESQLKELNRTLGIDLRKDLCESLGSTVVTYNSPSEGFSFLGSGFAIQVKDAERLQATLDQLWKGCSVDGLDIAVRKQKYHGVELTLLSIAAKDREDGLGIAPTYTIHNGWLHVGLYPQRVQGYVLRATEPYPTWLPSPVLKQALADTRAHDSMKVLAFTESDPRTTVKTLLSLAPVGGGYLHAVMPDGFDPLMIPNAHNVTRPLFPNATVLTDDGTTVRWEGFSSVPMPSFNSVAGAYVAAAGLSMLGGWTHVERVEADPVSFMQRAVGPDGLERIGVDFNKPQTAPAPPAVSAGQAPRAMPPVLAKPLASAPLPVPAVPPPYVMPPGTVVPVQSQAPVFPQIPGYPQSPVAPFQPATPPPAYRPAEPRMTTRVYAVGDLVQPGMGQTWDTAAAGLLRHVQLVDPSSWIAKGGGANVEIYAPTRTITVRQTHENHAEIERLLKELREQGSRE